MFRVDENGDLIPDLLLITPSAEAAEVMLRLSDRFYCDQEGTLYTVIEEQEIGVLVQSSILNYMTLDPH